MPKVTHRDEVEDSDLAHYYLCALKKAESPAEFALRHDIYILVFDLTHDIPAVRPIDIYIGLLEANKRYFFSDCVSEEEMHHKMRKTCLDVVAQLIFCKILACEFESSHVSEGTFIWRTNNAAWDWFADGILHIKANIPYPMSCSQRVITPADAMKGIKLSVTKSEKQAAIEAKIEHWRKQQAQKRAKNFHQDELAPAEPISSEPKEQSVGDEMREIYREQKRKPREKKAQQQEQQTKPKQKVNAKQQLQSAKRS